MSDSLPYEIAAVLTERDDLRDLLRALGDALDAGVRVKEYRARRKAAAS